MKRLIVSSLVFSVLLWSCGPKTKNPPVVEPPAEVPDTTASTATLLTKTVLTSGSNTTTKIYQYDAGKRLAWYGNVSTKADYTNDTTRIMRDADGNITQYTYRTDSTRKFPDPKLDSVVYTVFRDAGKYTYKLLNYTSYKTKFKDSTVYTYDAGGHIAKEETFYYDFKTTKMYISSGKTDYTWDGNGNMTGLSTVFYKVDGKSDYPFTIAYTYDDKVNLLNLGNEAVILGIMENYTGHNPLTMKGTYPVSPEYNRNITYVYKYNSTSRPLSAELSDAVTGTKSTLQFFYQ